MSASVAPPLAAPESLSDVSSSTSSNSIREESSFNTAAGGGGGRGGPNSSNGIAAVFTPGSNGNGNAAHPQQQHLPYDQVDVRVVDGVAAVAAQVDDEADGDEFRYPWQTPDAAPGFRGCLGE